LPLRLLPRDVRNDCLPDRNGAGDSDHGDARPHETPIALVLPHVGTVEFVLAHTAEWRGNIHHRLSKPRVR
jgi:hypothetical protein